jgi:Tfp pilus assembly ATPase PilU
VPSFSRLAPAGRKRRNGYRRRHNAGMRLCRIEIEHCEPWLLFLKLPLTLKNMCHSCA